MSKYRLVMYLNTVLLLAALVAMAIGQGRVALLAASSVAMASPRDQNDNESEDVPEEVLDELSLILNWAGGGASGTIGKGCDSGPVDGYTVPCEIAQNELLRFNPANATSARTWPATPSLSIVLRLPDGREIGPVGDDGESFFWWIPLDADPGSGALVIRQGNNTAQVPVTFKLRTSGPLTTASWKRDGPDAPTELASTGRAGQKLTVRMAGFPANQGVALILFRLVDSHALGPFASFDRPLASVQTDERGRASFVWDTDSDERPGNYAIHTVPKSETNWMFSDQGAQLCITPRNGSDLCALPTFAVGPEELIEPLIASTVTRAAQTFARLGREPTRSLTELECVYAGTALTQKRQQLQSLRAAGDVLDARLRRKVRVQSFADANPADFRPGVVTDVVERWTGETRHANGSDDAVEPRRQNWRYVLQRSGSSAVDATGAICGSGLVISEATMLP